LISLENNHQVTKFKSNSHSFNFIKFFKMKLAMSFVCLTLGAAPVASWKLGLTPYGRSLVLPHARDIIQQQEELLDRMMPDRFLPQENWLNNEILTLEPWRHSPQYDVHDTKDSLVFELDVPGVNANNIDITVKDDMLTVSGHREITKDKLSYRSQFSSTFTLDPTIDIDKVTAQIKNGVLHVTAPKDPMRARDVVKRIPVLLAAEESGSLTTGIKVDGHMNGDEPQNESEYMNGDEPQNESEYINLDVQA
jgi:HSP20 family protein